MFSETRRAKRVQVEKFFLTWKTEVVYVAKYLYEMRLVVKDKSRFEIADFLRNLLK